MRLITINNVLFNAKLRKINSKTKTKHSMMSKACRFRDTKVIPTTLDVFSSYLNELKNMAF